MSVEGVTPGTSRNGTDESNVHLVAQNGSRNRGASSFMCSVSAKLDRPAHSTSTAMQLYRGHEYTLIMLDQ